MDGRLDRRIKQAAGSKEFRAVWEAVQNILFPLVLLLFPLIKANQGVDLTDTGYSLGNYRFFGQTGGVWILLTFLSNVAGFVMTRLPMGGTMLGMKFYSSLLVGLMGALGYRFFKTKMPGWLAFAGELAAIGFCWCPPVILYNYLTYLLFLLGAVLLFRGLAGNRPGCLILAGASLGLNAFARFPGNVLEAGLIVAVWYYGSLKKKPAKQIAGETGLCMAGYFVSFLVMFAAISGLYGMNAFGDMISGVLGMAGSASDYTLGEMVLAIADAYFHGFQWLLYMLLCILPGIPFLLIRQDRFLKIRKVVYCLCIPVLFFVLGKWGMYNFRYYQKESALQWGAVFLLVSLGVFVWMLFTRMLDETPVTYTSSYGGGLEDMDSTLSPWSYERCKVIVGDDGIQKVELCNPYEIGEIQTENVKLMSFDEIIKIYEQMMEVSNADITRYETHREYHIRRITLGYMRIYDPTKDSDTGLLVPVWDFFGGFDLTEPDGTSLGKNTGEHSTQSHLTINAIDGTVIDRGLGY